MSLVSDDWSSEFQLRSERIRGLRKFTSHKKFEAGALRDLEIIKKYFVPSSQFNPYTEFINSTILTQKKKREWDDILDYGGFCTLNCKSLSIPILKSGKSPSIDSQ